MLRPREDCGEAIVMESKKVAYVDDPGRNVPVAYDVAVVIAGSGISGSMAAIAVARHGARTLVIRVCAIRGLLRRKSVQLRE